MKKAVIVIFVLALLLGVVFMAFFKEEAHGVVDAVSDTVRETIAKVYEKVKALGKNDTVSDTTQQTSEHAAEHTDTHEIEKVEMSSEFL